MAALCVAAAVLPTGAAPRAQTVADSIVLASVAGPILIRDGRRHAHGNSIVIARPAGGAERRWTALIEKELEEQDSELVSPVTDSAMAVRLVILGVEMRETAASIRIAWRGCGPVGAGWAQTISYHFVRIPGTWVYSRSGDISWAHGRCRSPFSRPVAPALPELVRRAPPPP